MTWSETHLRWQALRDVEAAIAHDPEAALPWHPAYADLFGDRDGLAAALRYRWTLRREAQLDPDLGPEAYSEARARLVSLHGAVVRVVRRHEQHREGEPLAHAS